MEIEKLSLGEFKIDNEFERKGGEALVSKAYHPRLGQVAVKRWLNNAYNSDNEIKLLIQNCNHPNIIQFVGILINSQSNDIGYIMPYMSNGSLADVIHNTEKYDQKQISIWIIQICCGLSHLHSKKIIHRDIKPSNVLLGKSCDDVKLSDVGMARSVENNANTLSTKFDESIKEWHLRIPYDHITVQFHLPYKISNGERPQLNNTLSAEVSDLLKRGWDVDPSKRPTVDDILTFYRSAASNVSEEQTILLLGGIDGKDSDSLVMLENNEQNWKQLNIRLPYAIWDHGAQFLNNNLYIFGGSHSNCTYKLSKSLQWEKMADMNQKRENISNSNVILNNQIWVRGGWNEEETYLKSVEMYDSETNTWKYMKEMNEDRTNAAAAVVNGKIFCCGGTDGWDVFNSIEYYDPSSDVWTVISDMPQGIMGHGVVEINGNLIVMGGYADKCLNSVWALDTTDKNAKWIEKPSMSIPRGYFGIAKIHDKIFICGGATKENNEWKHFDSVEIFDGEVWRDGPKMPTTRETAPAVVIPMDFARCLN